MRYGIEKIGMIRKTFVIGLDGRIEYADSNMESDCYRDNILQARGEAPAIQYYSTPLRAPADP